MVAILKGDRVPDQHHVVMHISPSHAWEVLPDGTKGGVSYEAIRVDDDGISCNWLEFFKGSEEEQYQQTCLALSRCRTVRRTHLTGKIRVRKIIEAGELNKKQLSVEHDPIEHPEPNPAHSLTKGACRDDVEIRQAIAVQLAVEKYWSGSNFPK